MKSTRVFFFFFLSGTLHAGGLREKKSCPKPNARQFWERTLKISWRRAPRRRTPPRCDTREWSRSSFASFSFVVSSPSGSSTCAWGCSFGVFACAFERHWGARNLVERECPTTIEFPASIAKLRSVRTISDTRLSHATENTHTYTHIKKHSRHDFCHEAVHRCWKSYKTGDCPENFRNGSNKQKRFYDRFDALLVSNSTIRTICARQCTPINFVPCTSSPFRTGEAIVWGESRFFLIP